MIKLIAVVVVWAVVLEYLLNFIKNSGRNDDKNGK